MAETLKEFLVEIGFGVDHASFGKTVGTVDKLEARATAATRRGTVERVEAAKKEGAERITAAEYRALMAVEAEKAETEALAKEAAKRAGLAEQEGKTQDRARGHDFQEATKAADKRRGLAENESKRTRRLRSDEFKDLEKVALRLNAVLGGVARGVTGVLGSAGVTALLANVNATAHAYTQLQVQAQRTGSTPRKIEAYKFAAQQMGVPAGEAESSFEGFAKQAKDNPQAFDQMMERSFDVRTTNGKGLHRDISEILEDFGASLAKMPENIANYRGEQAGLGRNTINALRHQAEFSKHVGEFEDRTKNFGLDPDKASADAQGFSKAYGTLALDLKTIKDKIEADFFVPLTNLMTGIDRVLNDHSDMAVKFGEGLLAFSTLMSLRVLPVVLKLSGAMGALTALVPPAWLLRLIGPAGAAAAVMAPTPAEAKEADRGQDGHVLSPEEKQARHKQDATASDPTEPAANDTRNWWQRRVPKWAGGKDAPPVGGSSATQGHGANLRDRHPHGPDGVAYDAQNAAGAGINAKQWDAYREGVTDIEGKRYDRMGGASGKYAGRYQMGPNEITATASRLGVERPTNEQFLKDPAMQERFFENYTMDHYNSLMKNEKFAALSKEEQLKILGYAHNQGAGGPANSRHGANGAWGYLENGQAGHDAFGTSGTAYFGPIGRRLAAIEPSSATPSMPSIVGSAEAKEAPSQPSIGDKAYFEATQRRGAGKASPQDEAIIAEDNRQHAEPAKPVAPTLQPARPVTPTPIRSAEATKPQPAHPVTPTPFRAAEAAEAPPPQPARPVMPTPAQVSADLRRRAFGATLAKNRAVMQREDEAFAKDDAKPPARSPFGSLNPDAFKVPPLGITPSVQHSIDNSRSRGDTNHTLNQNVTINGVQEPRQIGDQIKAMAQRGARDQIRHVEGSSQ